MKIILTGERGVGKSTILQKVIEELALKPVGFKTNKVDLISNSKVFISPYLEALNMDQHLCVAILEKNNRISFPNDFDAFALNHLDLDPQTWMVMDEIGFLESDAMLFKNKIISLFNSEQKILAVVKEHPDLFLKALLEIKETKVYHVTSENREKIYSDIIALIQTRP
ncbi:MAG: hypothetical protein JXR88_01805 [Clostridia bacterium]|nr:hypothetical protein [Clostridia bacterium]